MRKNRPQIELLTDNAITSVEQDNFERKDFVNAIAEIIHSQSTKVNQENDGDYKKVEENLIIGIFGEWGFGKSSIINMLDENLRKRMLLTAYFNPWMYGSEDQIIKSLFNLIIEKCGLEEKGRRQLVDLLKQYYPLVSVISPPTGKVMKASLSIIGKTEETDANFLKNKIDELLQGTANPLTIYIDDVDRLNKSEVQMLFKTLRLIASFKHVIYVVSCDFEMVAKSIKENYADGLVQDGRSFIDKIIQIPIRIPEIRPELLLNYGLEYIKKTVEIDLAKNDLFKKLFLEYIKNPRDVKRFINSFRFTYNFIGDKLMPPSDLITIELIKAKAPIQFDFIKLYYESLKVPQSNETLKMLLKKYIEVNNYYFFNPENNGRLDHSKVEISFANEIFESLFNLRFGSIAYYSGKLDRYSEGRNYYNIDKWKSNIPEARKQTLQNPEVFQQYMELRMTQKDADE